VSYEIIWKPRGVVKRFFDHVTSRELVQSIVEIEQDARFDNLRYCINDFLGITAISSSSRDVEDISVMDKGASLSNPRIKIAVVTTSPEVIAWTNEYANSALNSYTTKLFSSLGEAESWLASEYSR
jgi:hypothetical protein